MNNNKFEAIKVGLASPERILEWSYGEVTKPETINYRTQKPERDGLFCERIFGPSKDWECACGKYKKVRYKGVVCDKCGVEITKSSVRRERMGHITLATPVSHIWYLKGNPSHLSTVLDIPVKQLEEIIYFVSWVVIEPGDTDLTKKQVLPEITVREYQAKYGKTGFIAATGAEAIKTLLENVDIPAEIKKLKKEIADLKTDKIGFSQQSDNTEKTKKKGKEGKQSIKTEMVSDKRKKLIKRLESLSAFQDTGNKPEWMILTVLPVIPPDLRPMLQLDGGRFATSDLNDLYRRIITRNNRLKRLIETRTPNIILQNEKRMLQDAVDALIDNGRRGAAVKGTGNRDLKSLANSLKGKQGRFRQNLLGKRVDFSGRSVIAVGPNLKMNECGLPREMAIILYKPFVINELVNEKFAQNAKFAERMIERGDPQIWDILEDLMDNHPVFLNRAPTLHRLGIQAFKPRLIEGKAIRLHPLVCTAFNADFDGDQMAVHLPLSEKARAEAEVIMMANNNILGPKDGKPIVTPSQDMVLGNFYLHMEETEQEFLDHADIIEQLGDADTAATWRRFASAEGHVYKDYNEAIIAYNNKQVHLHTRIAIPAKSLGKTCFTSKQQNMYLITTVGKLIFNQSFPSDFPYINYVTPESLKATPNDCFVALGTDVKEYLKTKPVGPEFKKKDFSSVIAEVFNRYHTEGSAPILDYMKDLGFKYSTIAGMTISLSDITVAPNKQKYVDEAKKKADVLQVRLKRGQLTPQEWEKHFAKLWSDTTSIIGDDVMNNLPRKSPIAMSFLSGARGNKSNFTQMAGMRGLMARPTQSKSKKKYQPSIIEVPIYSSFREGLNVSEFFISTHGVRKGLTDTALKTAESGFLTRRLVDVSQDVIIREEDCHTDKGYYVESIVDTKDGNVIEKFYDRIVGRYSAENLAHPKTGEILVSKDEFIDEAIADKIIDAKITGMRIRNTFTCRSKIGICRKCYGRNMATGKLVESGEAVGIMAAQSIGEPGTQLTMRTFHTGGVAATNEDITQGLPRVEELFEARTPKHPAVISRIAGEITKIDEGDDHIIVVTVANDKDTIDHKLAFGQTVRSFLKVGSKVKAGDKLTEGHIDPKDLLQVAGIEAVQQYILKEVKKVYAVTGIDISDKHVEVIISQMCKKAIVVVAGDSKFTPGQIVSMKTINSVNNELGFDKNLCRFEPVLLGITKAALETDSFLSAASFQETTKVLTDAAVHSKVDKLFGIKENVIIGKLIPAGTGSPFERESTRLINERAEELITERKEKTEFALEEQRRYQAEARSKAEAEENDSLSTDNQLKEEPEAE